MKKIVFLSGTRADFGKIKSLISVLKNSENFVPHIFVTGMHLEKKYGYTVLEIEKSGFDNIFKFENTTSENTMDLTLAKTIQGFSAYVNKLKPDLIVIHGDRVEALAGAIVGSLNNVLVAHIEGGEVSGTIDELIRHSVSKMSHLHFVSNTEAKNRLLQMGELPESIKVIGSPDVDVMFSDDLPSLEASKSHYEITFKKYAIAMFHPVTTEINEMETYAKCFVTALLESGKNYLIVFPNNDLGSKYIIEEYLALKNNKKFRVLPSLRFEYFLVLLKNADFIIGNSSAGVREAPYYNLPTINIGTRQQNRVVAKSILNSSYKTKDILECISRVPNLNFKEVNISFGNGNSSKLFFETLKDNNIWQLSKQKLFRDI
ncbi:UDP-N-acetylglucosamine 2-epimerase [Tenacibaculum aquimarinum]|uniref:UDP-N-acetylglucosamine 2-epimerase n=1 Tax=Tenacibaculum aquimarinum TaxID=2910675 RepID=UPI001F0AD52A|nr:UDP-N-acetylglucosamine 2-epimerase [Tenacibaculum aquimarinum]MCH3884990.1 UDP-N-acetylglucosamine 2-epimerase [Tenacibaculum aquimarinum]